MSSGKQRKSKRRGAVCGGVEWTEVEIQRAKKALDAPFDKFFSSKAFIDGLRSMFKEQYGC